jgi:hypothetical protein
VVEITFPEMAGTAGPDAFFVEVRVLHAVAFRSTEICVDEDCGPATAQDGFQVRTVSAAGFESGSRHRVTARFVNRYGLSDSDSLEAYFVGPSAVVSISQPGDTSALPRLALDGEGRLHVVWQDACAASPDCDDAQPGNLPNDIFHRSLGEEGWGEITLLSDAVGDDDSRNPAIVTDANGDIVVVWQDDGFILGSGAGIDLYSRVYDAQAQRWGPLVLVTQGLGTDNQRPALAAAPDGVVHLAFEGHLGDNTSGIFHMTLEGGVWGGAQLVSDLPGSLLASNPDLAVSSGGVVYVVWQDNGDALVSGLDEDIFLVTLVNGARFGQARLLSDHPLDSLSLLPKVAIDSQDVAHVVWQDLAAANASGDDFDIFHRALAPGRAPTPYALVTDHPLDGFSEEVSLAIDLATDRLYVGWVDAGELYRSGEDVDLYVSAGDQLTDGPDPLVIFSPPLLISVGEDFDNDGEFPDMVFDPLEGVLHIVWEDESAALGSGPDQDIFYHALRPSP